MHPLVSQFIAGQMPEPMARTLLGGALPIPPLDLLQALSHAYFAETPYADKAAETLSEMPDGLLMNAIIGPVEPPDPLGLILTLRKDALLLETALLHESLNADWMERAIPHLPGHVLELPLNNQVLWLERPAILDRLDEHPEAVYNLKRKIQEFRRDVLGQINAEVAKDRLEIIDEVEAGHLDKAWAQLPIPVQSAEDDDDDRDPARAERLLKAIMDDEGNEISLTLTQRVMRLRTNQKILLAQKGGKEERTLLIRESNRLIQVAVIRNG
ncbi:MAG: hypothetical protein LWX11_09835, partial [Firmicutes bacterium]|nr:hypothetical protein [Bacillota bacterium]